MGDKRIDSAARTVISSTEYKNTAPYLDRSLFKDFYEIQATTDTGPEGLTENTYQLTEWTKVLAYYEDVIEFAALIDKAGNFTVGKGVRVGEFVDGFFKRKFKENKNHKKILENIKGNGKQNFNFMLYDWIKTFLIAGDCYVEIIRDSSGRLKNLRTLNPGAIRVVADNSGRVIRYEQVTGEADPNTWEPNEILHFAWNVKGNNWYGTSITERLMLTIENLMEAKKDMRIVFHRYAKPLLISTVTTDDTTEIATYKAKVEEAINKAEHLVIPEDTVKNFERVSIPQFSTLDPLPWIKMNERDFLQALGAPAVVQGQSGDSSESESKILYLAWEQVVSFLQLFVEINFKNQVGIPIDLEFPASIAPELITDNQKDKSKIKKEGVNPKTDV